MATTAFTEAKGRYPRCVLQIGSNLYPSKRKDGIWNMGIGPWKRIRFNSEAPLGSAVSQMEAIGGLANSLLMDPSVIKMIGGREIDGDNLIESNPRTNLGLPTPILDNCLQKSIFQHVCFNECWRSLGIFWQRCRWSRNRILRIWFFPRTLFIELQPSGKNEYWVIVFVLKSVVNRIRK